MMNTASPTANRARFESASGAPGMLARPRPPRQAALERAAAGAFRGGEAAFAVVGLFLFSAALIPLLLQEGGARLGSGEGNPLLRVVYGSVQAVSLLLVMVHWRAVWATLRGRWWTVALVALTMASVLWSAEPDVTLRRSAAFAGTTAFGFYLAARFDTASLLRLLGWGLGLAAVLSLVFSVALPSYGVESGVHAGAWRGVYPQKNGLGQTMVLSTLVFLLLALGAGRRRWIAGGFAALSAALVLASTSMTALAVLLCCVLLIPLFRALRLHPTLALSILAWVVLLTGAGAAWVIGNAEALLVSMGKDPTLTGRTPLWEILIEMIGERPWLGYGYSAFWLGMEGPSRRVLSVIDWGTPHAHNGFLDLALQLGLVGVLVFAVGFAIAAARSVGALRASPGPAGLWPLLFLTYMVLYNLSETTLLQQNNLYWVLYVATVCSWILRRREPEATTR